jgi:hypothetical protein
MADVEDRAEMHRLRRADADQGDRHGVAGLERDPDPCRVKSRKGGSAPLLLGVWPGQAQSPAIRSCLFVTVVVRWTMPQVCPKLHPGYSFHARHGATITAARA